MSRTLFRQVPTESRLLAVANYYRDYSPEARWRLGALFERNGQSHLQRFALEMSCVLAIGREFPGKEGAPYRSSGFKRAVVLPAIDTWQERQLGECHRLARKLAANPEIFGQRCFVFQANGMTVWMPKFELARKLFFHAGFLVRAAFEPNGLDMVFTIYREGEDFHIHTPAKTGVPSQLLRIKEYRDHFSWLLLNQDVKRSFESIWHSLNREQERMPDSAYARWKFDFQPYASLSGVTMDARGVFDSKSNELLIWEIEALQGLRFAHSGDIYFHHPALKSPLRGNGADSVSEAFGGEDIVVDIEEEPTEAKEAQLLHLLVEGIVFEGRLVTKIAYDGERAGNHCKRGSGEQIPSGERGAFGVGDPGSSGSIAPGEFQQLTRVDVQERFTDRFVQLNEIIKQIIAESNVTLINLEVKPLPPVSHCSYHKLDNGTPRCYMLAKFRLENGNERYLLEMDTSDNRKSMSTRIIGFKADLNAEECIDRILRETVKGSLRWSSSMAKDCEPLCAVHHPKEKLSTAKDTRVLDWKQRIRLALS